MLKTSTIAFASLLAVAAGVASADKLGTAAKPSEKGAAETTKVAKREMPANDDFASVTFRAGVGGSSPACCPADLNCDGIIDGADLAALLSGWGSAGVGDINADGNTNGADLAILLGAWGACQG
ncbi:MAG: hypothetical protein RI967_1904 [Planctomycetota bacterium]|jgi:hypothetical protein